MQEASTLTKQKWDYVMARTKKSKQKPPFPRLHAFFMGSVSIIAMAAAGALKPSVAAITRNPGKTGVVMVNGKRAVLDFESGSFIR